MQRAKIPWISLKPSMLNKLVGIETQRRSMILVKVLLHRPPQDWKQNLLAVSSRERERLRLLLLPDVGSI